MDNGFKLRFLTQCPEGCPRSDRDRFAKIKRKRRTSLPRKKLETLSAPFPILEEAVAHFARSESRDQAVVKNMLRRWEAVNFLRRNARGDHSFKRGRFWAWRKKAGKYISE